MRMRVFTQLFVSSILLCLVFPSSAYAYIDPGTGSLIFQMLLAGLIGILFAIKVYWRKIKAFLGNRFSKRGREQDDD